MPYSAAMTVHEAQLLLTPPVRSALRAFATRKDAFTQDALLERAIPPALVVVLLARDGMPPIPARVSLSRRTRVETTRYVWGPDIAGHLKGWD